jgi:SAM-dependent methyltransferase
MDAPNIDPAILRYYTELGAEDERIRSGLNELELLRTREIVRRFLPEGPLRLLDVGGASGVHAEWLLDDGHTVDLIDPVPLHVQQAHERIGINDRFSAAVGDGRSVPVEDNVYDAVLLFGPLYHLSSRDDRLAVWREARRLCRSKGLIFGAAISRFASLFSGLASDSIFDPTFRSIVVQDLEDGQHRNPSSSQDWFTTAFFSHPDELVAEAEDAGVSVEAILGVEGIAAWIPRLERSWDDPQRRQVIIESARQIESEPTLLGLGPHLMLVAVSP